MGLKVKVDGQWKKVSTVSTTTSPSGGTNDYSELLNRPSINGITLAGDKTSEQLGLATKVELNAKQDTLTEQDKQAIANLKDVSHLATKTELNSKQNTLTAGDNISIIDNVISVNDISSGTTNYGELSNKPSINNIELDGNKTLTQLGIQPQGNYVTDTNYVHTDNNYTTNEKTKLSNLDTNRQLPTVTASDNDKVLKVVDGQWTVASLTNLDEVSY